MIEYIYEGLGKPFTVVSFPTYSFRSESDYFIGSFPNNSTSAATVRVLWLLTYVLFSIFREPEYGHKLYLHSLSHII